MENGIGCGILQILKLQDENSIAVSGMSSLKEMRSGFETTEVCQDQSRAITNKLPVCGCSESGIY